MAHQLRAFVALTEDPGSVLQHPHRGSQLITPVPEDLMPFSDLQGTTHTHIHAGCVCIHVYIF